MQWSEQRKVQNQSREAGLLTESRRAVEGGRVTPREPVQCVWSRLVSAT